FCFWFGSTDPHRQYKWESGVNSGIKLEDVRVPPYLPDSETVRKDICDYYFAVQRFDRETGELLDMLERLGELENTLVVISGDSAIMCGQGWSGMCHAEARFAAATPCAPSATASSTTSATSSPSAGPRAIRTVWKSPAHSPTRMSSLRAGQAWAWPTSTPVPP